MNKNDALSRDHHRLMIAVYDFDESRHYLSAIDENTPDRLKASAILAAVISYSRPFKRSNTGKDNQASSRINIEPEKVLNSKELEVHKKIIEIRDSVVAHSDFEYRRPFIFSQGSQSYAFGAIETHHYLFELDVNKFRFISEKYSREVRIKSFDLYLANNDNPGCA